MSKRRAPRSRKGSWTSRVPRHVWVFIEVLALILALHYVPIPVSDILLLITVFTQGT